MASYHCTVKVGGKGKAAAHSAYLAREGKYSGRERYEDLEASGSGNMPKWAAHNPAHLWAAADAHERANGATYREIEAALPRELTPEQRRELVEDFIAQEIGDRHAYQWAIHTPEAALEGDEQPHVHIIYTERTVDGIDRDPEQYFKRYNAKNPERGGCRKDSAGTEERLQATRERWASVQNAHLERHGHEARVDHRSLKDQGIDRQPEKHLGGRGVRQLQEADLSALLERRAAEGERERAERQVSSIIDLSGDLAAAKADRDRRQAEKQRREQEERQQQERAERERIERMSSKELAQEIERQRPRRVHDLVEIDRDVMAAENERNALQNRHTEAGSTSAKYRDQAAAWREKHKVQAWLHDKGIGHSPALRQLEEQRDAAKTEWLTTGPRIQDADLRVRIARDAAYLRINAEQAPALAKVAELEKVKEAKARQEREAEAKRLAEVAQQRQRADLGREFAGMAAKRAMKASGWRDNSEDWQATPEVLRRIIDDFNKKPEEQRKLAIAALSHPKAEAQATALRQLMDERRENVRQLDRGPSLG